MLKETSTDSDDEEANSRSIMELDELISMERENLELIKKANESIRDCVTASVAVVGKTLTSIPVTSETDISNETSSSVPISNGDSPTENETPSSTGEPTEIDNPTNNGSDIKEKDKTEIDTATIITPQKPTQNLFRGLPTARRRKPGQRTAMGVNEFIKDYYRSLDSVSRYIIIASILSFITAFTLLYFHGYQTHQQNMELFQLKEKQTQAQLERYELTKTQSTNFRETVIHQRFEETRQCQVSLKTCNINNEALTTKIGKVEKDSSVLKLKLEMELKSSQDKIKQLQEAVSTLRRLTKS
ncbi:hypothetical protein Ocin01_19185 [Orchesella cincta]|uniref:Uncharacterized protein n=1 Tax=Orchesella cincta TaxID=48709 RepID=A0A1D2M3E3_ORCCI|nr:hypothetical protein Ocin01_19185 [Orchesella cincta]